MTALVLDLGQPTVRAEAPMLASLPRHRQLQPIRVLLVDDDAVDTKFVQYLAADLHGFAVEFVIAHRAGDIDGRIAGRRIDLALVDYWLGSETGLPIVRDLSHERAIPTVVLTCLDASDIRASGFDAGAVGFLSKHNLSTETLETVIAAALRAETISHPQRPPAAEPPGARSPETAGAPWPSPARSQPGPSVAALNLPPKRPGLRAMLEIVMRRPRPAPKRLVIKEANSSFSQS